MADVVEDLIKICWFLAFEFEFLWIGGWGFGEFVDLVYIDLLFYINQCESLVKIIKKFAVTACSFKKFQSNFVHLDSHWLILIEIAFWANCIFHYGPKAEFKKSWTKKVFL